MRRFWTAEMLTLAALLCVSTGCARWTIFPKAATPVPQSEEKPQGRSSLLQAVGLDRSAQRPDQAANNKAENRSAIDDLRNLDPALALARLAERQGSAGEARRQYRQFIDKHPSHPMPHHRLGVMAAREAKYDEAEVHFQTAARLSPPNAELLSDMGYLYYLQDRLGEAENLLRQASQLEPANQNANNNLALVLAAHGNFDNSLRQFRKVNPEAEARANLAYVHSHRGDLDKAREEYLRALTLDNTLKSAAQALLQVEEARKREQVAMAQYQQAPGDELLEAQPQAAAQQVQPQAMPYAPQRPAPSQYVDQASYNEPQGQFATTGQANAPQVARRNTSADMLMPIPAAGPVAAPRQPIQSTGHAFREQNSVAPASYVEPTPATLSRPSFQEPSATEAENFARKSGAEFDQQPSWNSAWQQLATRATLTENEASSRPHSVNLSDSGEIDTPTANSQPTGGVRISIGDE